MSKQIVHYDATKPAFIKIRQRATVTPIDHPDTVLVSNTMPCTTSPVQLIVYDSKGEIVCFETMNSIYKAVYPLATDVLNKMKEVVCI